MSTENKEQEQNPTVNDNDNLNSETKHEERQSSSTRTPFANLNQVDADLALARTLQEQERAYMMLSMNHDGIGSYLHGDDFDHLHDHDDIEDDDDDDDEGEYDVTNDDDDDDDADAFDNSTSGELDPADFSSDEAYARALQDAEEREVTARLFALAGINNRGTVTLDLEDHGHSGGNSQDSWEDVDPDELSYEELIALGEVVGTESRGLSADSIASLPSLIYKAGSSQSGSNDSCVICRLDYEDGDSLTALSCKHSYHPECINNWLKINKVCPVCSAEVSA